MRAAPYLAAACAVAVPLLLILGYVEGPARGYSGWELLDRVDIIATVFCAMAAALLVVQPEPRHAAFGAAAALMFVVFGMVLANPIELTAPAGIDFGIGGYLSVAAAFVSAGAALFAAEGASRD